MSKKEQNIAYGVILFVCLGIIVYYAFQKQEFNRQVPNISKRSGQISPSSEFLNIKKAVEYYRFEIRQNPETSENYVRLAQLYLQEARITGSHHEYIEKAGQLLEQALELQPDHFEALVTSASLWLTKHQFEKALAMVEQALQQTDFNALAWGVKSDALKELGRYDEAVRACDTMLDIRPDLRSYSRAAHLREIHGDMKGAREAMKLASDAGVIGSHNHAWSLYQLGNLYLNEGKLDTAEFVFNGILEARPNYPYALSGLARIQVAHNQYDEAIQSILRAYELAPKHEFMEQLIDVYKISGRIQQAGSLAEMIFDEYEQHEQQGWNINLEYARFSANQGRNLNEALLRIKKEYQRRPNHIEVLEVYAWLLYQLDRAEEAAPLIKRAMRINKRSATLNYHAGMIAHEMGQSRQAREYLETALEINHYLSPKKLQLVRQTLTKLKDNSQMAELF